MKIGCQFCEEHMEYRCPRKREIELAEATSLPIIGRTDERPPDAVWLQKEQEHVPGDITDKLKVTSPICLKQDYQTCVTVST